MVVRIKPSALNSASDSWVKNSLVDYILDSVRGVNQAESCIFGSCSLQNFNVNNYVAPKSEVTFIRGKGIEWNLIEAACDIRFDFELKGTDAYVRGNASIQLYGISLATELALCRGNDGRLLISVTKSSAKVLVLDSDVRPTIIHKDGNSDTIGSSLREKLHGYLKVRMNETRISTAMLNLAGHVARAIPDSVYQLNMELSSRAGFFLDDTLVKEPTLETDYIEVAFRAEFRMVGDEEGASIQPHDLDLPPSHSSMIGIYISDYVINTLCEVLFKKHLLSVNITKDLWFMSIYSYYRDLFDTSCENEFCFKNIFPNIAEKYPNAFAKFAFRITSPPLASFSRGAGFSQGELELSILIPGVDGSEVTVTILPLSYSKSAALTFHTFKGNRVVGIVTDTKQTFTDRGSPEEFASFVPRLNLVMKTITESILLPWSNIIGAIGFPLTQPNCGIRMFNTDIGFNPGVFRFSTDVAYDPTTSAENYDYFRTYSSYLYLLFPH